MKPGNPLDALVEQVANLPLPQLQDLYGAIEALIAVKTRELSAQTAQSHPPTDRTKGSIEWKIIPDAKRGKVYGPYPYLRYWQAGHLKSKYLKGYRAELPTEALQRLEQAKAALKQPKGQG